MEESKDPVIKLFGKTIQLPAVTESLATSGEDSGGYEEKASSNPKQDNHEPKHKNEETRISETNEEENNPMDKTAKKPDKILPCPRCKSMDTKFCYFNNYNVNQPRYFCKQCQRYWTEGGSMRNVQVGAGRRKSKTSTTNHHITISDCAQADSLVTPFYPMTPYFGMPWLCSGLNSTVSGKRSREESIVKAEKCIWLPKTSRINGDHDKAAKCSVWRKLGLNNNKTDRLILKNISSEASQVLCANPAALSRSLNFHERS